ncbi:unnamed protein product, partial [Prorocentrum cordatum]
LVRGGFESGSALSGWGPRLHVAALPPRCSARAARAAAARLPSAAAGVAAAGPVRRARGGLHRVLRAAVADFRARPRVSLHPLCAILGPVLVLVLAQPSLVFRGSIGRPAACTTWGPSRSAAAAAPPRRPSRAPIAAPRGSRSATAVRSWQMGKDLLANPIDASEMFDRWVEELCPEVCAHFRRFPYFRSFGRIGRRHPLTGFTTRYAAYTVCLFKMFAHMAATASAQLYLYSRSVSGAILNGGPTPWDDYVDAFIDYDSVPRFLQFVEDEGNIFHSDVELVCERTDARGNLGNALKCYAKQGLHVQHATDYPWPYVDIFIYKISVKNETRMITPCSIAGVTSGQAFNADDYFSTSPYFFGGICLFGPHPRVMQGRHESQQCKMSAYNNRLERVVGESTMLHCCKLMQKLPFVHRASDGHVIISNGVEDLRLWSSPLNDFVREGP